ncbi:MAG: BolA family protein [Arsenophonus sp.]
MDINKIKQALTKQLKFDEIIINGDGRHFKIIAVCEIFNGMSQVQRQQIIYEPLMEYITDNCIHSLSIRAYTHSEWIKYSNINNF